MGKIMNNEIQIGKTKNSIKFKATKIVAGLSIPLVMAGSFSGCEGVGNFFSNLRDSFSSGSHGSEEDVPTTRRPKPTTTKKQVSEIDAKMALAPNIEGTKKVAKEIGGYQRVTYERNGIYIGEFKKEVFLEGKEVGGVALIPNEVEKLLNEGLAKIPSGKDKWMLFVPADISEFKSKDSKVEMEIVDISKYKDIGLKVSFDENVSISNTIKGLIDNTFESSIVFGGSFGFGLVDIYEKPEQTGFVVMGNLKFSKKLLGYEVVEFGKKLTETDKTIMEYISSSDFSLSIIDNTRILKIDKSPVFVIDK